MILKVDVYSTVLMYTYTRRLAAVYQCSVVIPCTCTRVWHRCAL